MIDKLNIEDRLAGKNCKKYPEKLLALQTITELLKQIDFMAEVVPFEDPERMIKLLGSLKDAPLSNSEVNLVYEMAKTR